MVVIAGLVILVGIAGVVVPVVPGLALVWGGIALWALSVTDVTGWVVLALATLIGAAGTLAKYAVPGRRLRGSGVPWTTMALGAALGVVGFFLVPVVGVVLGFVLGVYLAERLRLRTHAAAWPTTKQSLGAVGWSMLIELAAALSMTATWVAGVALT